MPKVDQITVRVYGKNTTYDVWYTKREKFHLKNCPLFIKLSLLKGYSTLEGLKQDLQEMIDRYYAEKKKVEKIIVLQYSLGRETIDPDIKSDVPYWLRNREYSTMSYDLGFGISYQILWRTEDNGVKYYNIEKNDEIGHQRLLDNRTKWIIIPWTEEKEKTLEILKEQVSKVSQQIHKILKEESSVESLLAGKIKLLT